MLDIDNVDTTRYDWDNTNIVNNLILIYYKPKWPINDRFYRFLYHKFTANTYTDISNHDEQACMLHKDK